nr:immunoglobulin light chain junction region [Macaca mulatta]MOW36016.1 immunoglobulin light chain junction region [Macaca mulatta]MOW36553.1 immunoglobulin light chain junction region [Macaca mulatta]MOW36592.1 immunoglobulin light chain junction region [Macaca mulatta]MOW36626.1 immunoglobulin light chain junction region [Macaca mulatta]
DYYCQVWDISDHNYIF